jgi:translation initiation factor 1
MGSASRAGGLVYSTEQGGRTCPACRRAVAACACAAAAAAAAAPDAGPVRVSRETKGRGGKTVTLVRGLPLDAEALQQLGKRLRSACGTGGTARDGVLELQGDHRERVLAWLRQEGWPTAKLAGG